MRLIIAVIAACLPQRAKHVIYRRFFHWDVHPTASIGCSLIHVDHLVVGEGVRISHLNMFRGLELLHFGAGAMVGAFNWVGAPARRPDFLAGSPDRRLELVLGKEASLTNRHVLDCSDRITIDDYAILGGIRCQVLTHSIDLSRSVQESKPVTIGARSLVLTGCILLPGAVVPPKSVVAAGAVVTGDLGDGPRLFGGVPAKPLRDIDPDGPFFQREHGYVR
ncbi:MAG: wbbJ [Acidimicrobiales bacterium]|nr:wbbJ [Acidimicrobiales bacterium]